MYKAFIFIFLSISVFCLGKVEHLIIYMDVNRTIYATDKVQGKDVESSIDSAIAKKIYGIWDENIITPINFYDYLYFHKFPGKRGDPQVSKNRKQALKQCLQAVKKIDQIQYEKFSQEKALIMEALQNRSLSVFPSFYRLVEFLEKQAFTYTLVFRSFGNDFIEVSKDLLQTLNWEVDFSYFNGSHLHFEDQIFSTSKQQYQFVKNIKQLWIKDDFHYWYKNKEKQSFGKPMLVDLTDENTLCFFFDDNISRGEIHEKNIVNPVDVSTRKRLRINPLIDHSFVVQVDMIEAIINPDFFINKIKDGLKNKDHWRSINSEQKL